MPEKINRIYHNVNSHYDAIHPKESEINQYHEKQLLYKKFEHILAQKNIEKIKLQNATLERHLLMLHSNQPFSLTENTNLAEEIITQRPEFAKSIFRNRFQSSKEPKLLGSDLSPVILKRIAG